MHIPENHALLIRNGGNLSVSFRNRIIWPFQTCMLIDISPRTFIMEYLPPVGLLSKDFRVVHMTVACTLKVIKTEEAITSLARKLTIEKISDEHYLKEYFNALASEMIKTAVHRYEAAEIIADRTAVQNECIREISRYLNEFTLEQVDMSRISISDELIDREKYPAVVRGEQADEKQPHV